MEGLAFPSPPSRAAGSEEAGRRSCLSFPANVRKIKAGKRVLSRRERGLGNGVKNPDRERGCLRIVSQTIFPHTKWKRAIIMNLNSFLLPFFFLPDSQRRNKGFIMLIEFIFLC
jgi:hypothetical protein